MQARTPEHQHFTIAPHYIAYDGTSSIDVSQQSKVTSYDGVLAFDFGILDEPASQFINALPSYWGLRMLKESASASTETIASFSLCDNKMNRIKLAVVPGVNNTTWFRACEINLNYGDVNYDGTITSEDANAILNYIVRNVVFSDLQQYLGDYNRDGTISLTDVTAINQILSEDEQAALLASISKVYNSLSIEERAEYETIFTELKYSLSAENAAPIK